MSNRKICSVEMSGCLDNIFRRWGHNPRKILKDYIKEGMIVLDVGCGPCFFTLEIAGMVGEAGKVIAVDLQAEMLDKARNKVKGGELEKRVIFHKTTEDKIGIAKEVDFALVFYMLHEVPDQGKFFAELGSILRPGGKILLVEPKFHVSKKMFENSVNKAVVSGLNPAEKPKIFFSRSVVLKK
ncbi:MAG: methyltransferase domain-containing protein [Candidatus Omnitrophota bacterium]